MVGDTVALMRTPDELTERFRATGRKVTAQRQCIFRVLQGDVTHPSAEAVHALASREMETISLKTVYQTLYDLAELGEIATLDVGTGMTRFDPNVDDPHHHLVCHNCGSVRDLVATFPGPPDPQGCGSRLRGGLGRDRVPGPVPRVPVAVPDPPGPRPVRPVTVVEGPPDVNISNPPAEASAGFTPMKGTP